MWKIIKNIFLYFYAKYEETAHCCLASEAL